MTDQDIDTSIPSNFISSKEASERFGYTPDYVSKLAREGKVRGHKSGHAWFVDPESLEVFIREVVVQEQRRVEELHRARVEEYRNGHTPRTRSEHGARVHPLAQLTAPVLGAAVFSVAVGMGYAFVEVRPLARIASVFTNTTPVEVESAQQEVAEVLQDVPLVTLPSFDVAQDRARKNFSLTFPSIFAPNVVPDTFGASPEFFNESLYTLFLDAPVVVVSASALLVDAYVEFLLDVPRRAVSLEQSVVHAVSNPREFATRLTAHVVSLWIDRDLIADELMSDVRDTALQGRHAYHVAVEDFVDVVHVAIGAYVNGVLAVADVVTAPRTFAFAVNEFNGMSSAYGASLTLFMQDVFGQVSATSSRVTESVAEGVRSPQLALSWSPQAWISDVGTLLWGTPDNYMPPPLVLPRGSVTTVSTTPTTLIQNITQPLTISGVSSDLLTTRLQELENELRNEINLYSARADRGISGNYRAIGLTNVINNLDGVTIRNATIIGGSISGTSGIGGGGASDLDDLSDVTIASPALGQVLLYDGSTWNNVATSSLGITGGGASFGQAFELTNGALAPTTTVGILVSASSTIQSLSTTNATSTNATSTNLYTSNLTVGSLSGILKATSGVISTATAGVDYLTDAFRSWALTTNTFGQSALAPTTTQNLLVSGTGTSTFAGGLEAWRQIAAPYFHATSTTATSTFAGGLVLRDGTEGSPSLSFASDLTSGIYRSASQRVGVTVNGAKSFEFLGSSNAYITSGLFRIANGTVGGPAYSFSNDTNTGIFTTGGDTLNFATAGIERARFTIAGLFGVGTSTPLAQLSASSTSAIGLIVDQRGAFDVAQFQIAGVNALSIAGTGFGTTTLSGLNIAGSATSTSNVGFNITTGCFAINGTCVGGSSGITALGPVGQTQTGATVTIASSTSSFNGLTVSNTIVGSGNTLTWTPALSGTLDNTGLTNSTVSFGGVSLALGGSDATPAFNLADATGLPIVAGTTGTLTATRGGTGLSTIASSSLLIGGAGNTWLQFATSSLGIALSDTTGTLSETRGGTNQTSYATGDILYASGANTLSRLAAGTGGFVLAMANGVPAWVASTTLATISGTLDLATQVGSSILSVTNGGTGWANIQANSILLGNGTSRLATTSAGTNGQILSLVSGVPAWVSTTTYSGGLTYSGGNVTADLGTTIDLASAEVTGTLAVGNGGTGATSLSNLITLSTHTTGDYLATLSGTANQITVTGSGGEGSTPTISVPSLFSVNLASTTGLSALGNLYAGNGTATTTIIGNATSTFGAGIEATYLNITGTAATSTFARGIDLAGGCFAINGVCVGGGSGSPGGSDGQLQYNNGGSFGGAASVYYDDVNNLLGIGSTSPWAKLAVNPVAGDVNQFVVGSSTATSFIINSAGRVGVGNSAPTSLLSVGDFNVSSAVDVDLQKNFGQSTFLNWRRNGSAVDARIGVDSSEDLYIDYNHAALGRFLLFRSNSSEVARFDSTGNFGIATSSPWARLAVNPIAGDTNQFVVGSSTATSFLIDNAGRVGIGTTTPGGTLSSRFSINGTASVFASLDFTDATTRGTWFFTEGSVAKGFVQQQGSAATAGREGNLEIGTIAGAGSISLWTNSLERLRITTTGNVGIGTTTPDSILSLISADPVLLIKDTETGTANTNVTVRFAESGASGVTDQFVDLNLGGSGVFSFIDNYTAGGGTGTRFVVSDAGNFGIGTTTPWRKLSVADTVANSQFALAYDTTRYATFQVTSVGDLVIDAEGADVSLLDENLYVCTGGSCPTPPAGTGNLLVEGILILPNGTAPTVSSAGALALDTSGDDQLLVADEGGTARVIQTKQKIWSVTVASTSPAFISAGLLAIPVELDGYTMTDIRCKVDSGTSKIIAIEDASANSTEDITCATTVTSDDGSITNATATAEEEMYIDFGATSGAVDTVSITVYGYWTRE